MGLPFFVIVYIATLLEFYLACVILFAEHSRTIICSGRNSAMKLDAIREIAKQHGIKPARMKKAELIHAIQQAEVNEQCFDTGKSETCGQDSCSWREDCD